MTPWRFNNEAHHVSSMLLGSVSLTLACPRGCLQAKVA